MGARKKETDKPEDARTLQQSAAMNQELMLAVVRQHELTETAERLNAQLQAEMAERKLAEEARSESDAKYRLLFENMHDGFAYCKMLFDAQGHPADFVYLDVNSAFGRLTGLEDVIGKKVSEVIPGARESNPELFEIYARIAQTGMPERFEIDFKPLGRWFSTSVYSTKREYFVAVFDDITERKLAEEARSASELRYRRLFESAMDGILLLDADKGTVYDVNPSLVEMLGYSHGEMVGKEPWETGPIKNIETAKDAFRELLKKDQARYENLPLETSDGRIIEVEVVSSVYMVNKTRVVQCNFRDISERKALEIQKADFYAMITHDIRSPLTVISAYSELLASESGKFDAETNEMVASIMKSGKNIETLIENFLTISKMESGKLVIHHSPTDIAKLLRDSCQEIEMAVQEKKLDLKVEIADGLPEAMVDSRLIHRSVMNLLHNAVNYTPAPGTITLSSSLEGNGYIMISVADTGKGIPDDERYAIFDKYYRSERTAGVKGSGLGLAIVKAAVDAHGGMIEVESEVGKGSTFRLFIPVKKGDKQETS